MSATCPFCGVKAKKLTREHVIPRAWYPEGTADSSMPQVPSCRDCNSAFGRLEERLMRTWGMCLDRDHPASASTVATVMRSMDPDAGRNERDSSCRRGVAHKLRHAIEIRDPRAARVVMGKDSWRTTYLMDATGAVVQGVPALPFPASDVFSFVGKLVRGLYRLEAEVSLDRNVPIRGGQIHEDQIGDWTAHFARMPLQTRNLAEGFGYAFGIAREKPIGSVWAVWLWDQVLLVGISGVE